MKMNTTDEERIIAILGKEFPAITETHKYSTPGSDAAKYRFKLKDGVFTDVELSHAEMNLPDLMILEAIREKLRAFFGIPTKKKRATMSKQQKLFKKRWSL